MACAALARCTHTPLRHGSPENGLHCACALHTHPPRHGPHENGLHCACALHTHPLRHGAHARTVLERPVEGFVALAIRARPFQPSPTVLPSRPPSVRPAPPIPPPPPPC